MTLANPTEVAETLLDQLKAKTVAHRDAQEVARRCAAAFRQAVVEAVDAGVKIKHVAQVAGVAPTRVHAIVVAEDSRP